jgi:hypothetical protein
LRFSVRFRIFVNNKHCQNQMQRALLDSLIAVPKRMRASPKDYDPNMGNERLSWEVHAASCEHIGNFNTYYHMSVLQFETLYSIVSAAMETCPIKAKNATPMGPVEGKVKFACTLRILYGEKMKSLAQIFHISIATVKLAFKDGVAALLDSQTLNFGGRATLEQCETRAHGFLRRSNYPDIFAHCVSCIDGLAVRISCPKDEVNQKAYYSGHKKFYCINLQAACDSNCMFTHFSLNCPGSANDLLAYRKSQMSVDFASLPKPFWVAGDNAYPDGDHLLTPFPSPYASSPEDSFNFYLSQLRITIERAFGIMVTLFGILQSAIKTKIPFTVKIVQACMRVHNYRIAAGCQPPRRSGCINYADPDMQCADLLMADPRFETDPVASTPRLIVSEVQQHFETSTFRREALCDILREAGGERPVGNVAQRERAMQRELMYANPLLIQGI